MWLHYFKIPLDTLPDGFPQFYDRFRDWFFKAEVYDVYELAEFACLSAPSERAGEFAAIANAYLERELSAYRIVGGHVTAITDKTEVAEVESAIERAEANGVAGARAHLETALSLMSDRKKSDYRNSIKESISAVESICQSIAGGKAIELGQALKVIEDRIGLHPALKRAFSAAYGYTSAEGGIRHAMLEQPNLGFGDARYMLVSCSAFVNYLRSKSEKSGVRLG